MMLFACAEPVDSEPADEKPRPDRDSADTAADSADTGEGPDSGDSGRPDSEDSDPPDSGDTTLPGTGGSGGALGRSTGSVGSSSYDLYAPACAAEGPVAAIFSMHGSGGDGGDMVGVWQTLADRECFIVVGLDSESGMSWNFDSDVGNFADLAALVDQSYDVNRHYLHGYSAGAHWTYIVGIYNSLYFTGLGVYAGSLSYAESWGYWPDPRATPIPVAIAHGTADTTVPYSEAEHALEEFSGAGWPAELDSYSGGSHAFELGSVETAWAFWKDNR